MGSWNREVHNLEVINAADALHECLVLEYAENARLYLRLKTLSYFPSMVKNLGFWTSWVVQLGRQKRPNLNSELKILQKD